MKETQINRIKNVLPVKELPEKINSIYNNLLWAPSKIKEEYKDALLKSMGWYNKIYTKWAKEREYLEQRLREETRKKRDEDPNSKEIKERERYVENTLEWEDTPNMWRITTSLESMIYLLSYMNKENYSSNFLQELDWIQEKFSVVNPTKEDIKKILIINDSESSQQSVKEIIIWALDGKVSWIEFVYAKSINEGITFNEIYAPKLVILDWILNEFSSKIKWNGWYCHEYLSYYKHQLKLDTKLDTVIIFSGHDDFIYETSKRYWVDAFHKYRCYEQMNWDPDHFAQFESKIREKLNH